MNKIFTTLSLSPPKCLCLSCMLKCKNKVSGKHTLIFQFHVPVDEHFSNEISLKEMSVLLSRVSVILQGIKCPQGVVAAASPLSIRAPTQRKTPSTNFGPRRRQTQCSRDSTGLAARRDWAARPHSDRGAIRWSACGATSQWQTVIGCCSGSGTRHRFRTPAPPSCSPRPGIPCDSKRAASHRESAGHPAAVAATRPADGARQNPGKWLRGGVNTAAREGAGGPAPWAPGRIDRARPGAVRSATKVGRSRLGTAVTYRGGAGAAALARPAVGRAATLAVARVPADPVPGVAAVAGAEYCSFGGLVPAAAVAAAIKLAVAARVPAPARRTAYAAGRPCHLPGTLHCCSRRCGGWQEATRRPGTHKTVSGSCHCQRTRLEGLGIVSMRRGGRGKKIPWLSIGVLAS